MTLAMTETAFARVVKLLLGVIVVVISARALGPSGRGEYYLVITIAALVMQISNAGLHASNTYIVARDRSSLATLANNSLWIAIVLGGSLALLTVLGAQYAGLAPATGAWYLGFVVPLVPAGLYLLLGLNLLVGAGRMRAFNLIDVSSSALAVLCAGLATLILPTPVGFLVGASTAAIAAAAVVHVALHGTLRRIRPFDLAVFRMGLSFAAKAYAIALLALLVLRLNVLTLYHFAGSAEVGEYSIALQFVDVLGIVPSAIALVVFPAFVRDPHAARHAVTRNVTAVGGILTLMALGFALLAPTLVRALFGDEFQGAAHMLIPLLPGAVLIGMAAVLSQFVIAVGFPRSLVVAWAGAAISALVLGLILIPMGGGRAAGWALSLTYAGLFIAVLALAIAHRNDRGAAGVVS